MSHHYISTACLHEDERPELHGSCRATCKFCDAPCACPNHPAGDGQPAVAGVDVARGIATELLAAFGDDLASHPVLAERICTDPALFWPRGEVQPPGEWRQS